MAEKGDFPEATFDCDSSCSDTNSIQIGQLVKYVRSIAVLLKSPWLSLLGGGPLQSGCAINMKREQSSHITLVYPPKGNPWEHPPHTVHDKYRVVVLSILTI